MAAAILLDAFMTRMTALPAAMRLGADAMWWPGRAAARATNAHGSQRRGPSTSRRAETDGDDLEELAGDQVGGTVGDLEILPFLEVAHRLHDGRAKRMKRPTGLRLKAVSDGPGEPGVRAGDDAGHRRGRGR
jgi:hypothetical protein